MSAKSSYTCQDYRLEMILLGLRRRLNSTELTEKEKVELRKEIGELEQRLGMN